jgi:branched-subunit amino acid transport protein
MIAISTPALIAGIVVLGAGTYALRAAGPVLRSRIELGERPKALMNTATVVLLTALVATVALVEGGATAGIARPAGVLVGGVLAWRRAPFALVVVAAAVTAAGLRWAGVP